ncbi:E3 ubiquitin-protein ligase UPL6-like [Cucumis sativus]|uniref:E3 ubiquitin-protein ligase UPL6-like n=1 Tax=Cucumis sativus TaxID=3659 RepID=UPI0012F4FB94|nr:E3 ubiquitin-protein ligase UPL6-like [Cucumis sativus]
MENITRAAFDVQYGLFKQIADHLLYPNPGSGMIHEQHLQFFHFLEVLLAKQIADHLLYPNPGSGMIHEQHLQFFHFLEVLLAKVMFEGTLVDILFATFFLSKLKQK